MNVNVEPKRAPASSWSWAARHTAPGLRDVQPLADAATFWRGAAQAATIAMAIILFGAFLYFARSLLVPLLAALVVSLTVGPIAGRVSRRRVPDWVSALAIVLLLAAFLYGAIAVLAQPVSDFMARSSEVGDIIRDRLSYLDRPLATLRELQGAVPGEGETVTVAVNQTSILGSAVMVITPAALGLLLFFTTLFFFLIGRKPMRRYVVNLFTTRDSRLRALRIVNDIEDNLSRYLVTVTGINAGLGIVTTAATWAMGLPSPLLWGALAFTLNYIPYAGPAIMYVILFVVGLLTYPTLIGALVPPVFYMGLTLVEGQFLAPNIIGRRLFMHPLAVFLSFAFWAWMWGPVGAFLATPILIMATVALNHLYPIRRSKTLPG